MDEAEQDIYKEFNVTEEFVAEWLNRFKGDKEIQAEFDLLKKIADLVFDPKEGTIMHIPCKDMPEGLNEDSYILVYRKQQACIRYQIQKILKETGGATQDPVKQREQQELFMEVMKKRPEFQKKSCELYGIKPVGDKPLELIMREAYLDFYSKSLQPSNKDGVAYSKRLQKEQKEHNAKLEILLKAGTSSTPENEQDPLLTKDELEPKFKIAGDGIFLEKDEKKDESKDGIAGRILEKMKQNKEEEEKAKETESKEESKEVKAVDDEIKNLEKVKELIDEKIAGKQPEEKVEDKKEEKKQDPVPEEKKPEVVPEEKKPEVAVEEKKPETTEEKKPDTENKKPETEDKTQEKVPEGSKK